MEEIIAKVNMVVYLIAGFLDIPGAKRKREYFLGGHGYTYDLTQEGKKKLAKDVATSNGYYTSNLQKANTVVVVEDILSLIVSNSHSQLEAILRGFERVLREFVVHGSPYKNLCVIAPYRELEMVLKLKRSQLEKDDFKFGTHIPSLVERELLEECLRHLEDMARDDKKIIIDLPGAAEGGAGNRDAQRQADLGEAATMFGNSVMADLAVIPRKVYENPESDFNKIVEGSRWFSETKETETFFKLNEGYRVYSFGKVEPDKNYYGKVTPDVTYSKLFTKRPITLLDKLYSLTAKKINNPSGYLSAGDLNNIVRKDTARLIDTFPAVPSKNDMVSPITKQNGRAVLIELISPVLMSYRVREFLVGIDVIFNAFMKRDADNKFGYTTFYDITDQVYLKEVNGKGVTKLKLQPDFTQLKQIFKVKVEHPKAVQPVEITLSVGLDIPSRNSFNSVEDPNVKVWVMTDTRNDTGIRYATVVETEEFIYILTSAAAGLKVLSLDDLGMKK